MITKKTLNSWTKLGQFSDNKQVNLICFPFAGGYAEYYLPWSKKLPDDFALCPIQLPGRSYRMHEAPIIDIKEMVDNIIESIEPLLQDRYCIFGHSMGGYIAYEFCKEIIKRNQPQPELLVVSSVPAPFYWRNRRKLSECSAEEFESLFLNLGGFRTELLEYKSFIKSQMLLLKNDIQLCESCNYEASAKFSIPIIAMGATDDQYVEIKMLQEWKIETSSSFDIYEFTGGHFYLNEKNEEVLHLIRKKFYE